jgi:cytidine deaminase
MEDHIWKMLYDRAKAVRGERKLSPLMEVGSVGAAVLTDKGNIYTGVCIDTCCSLGMCAERNAIANMITNGESRIVKLVCIMGDGRVGSPCGACRELMVQIMAGNYYDIEIMLDYSTGKTVRLGEITPEWWIK